MALNIFSIEDDSMIQKDIEILLSKRTDVNFLGFASSIKEAVRILPNLKVDVVLMDIELTDGKSFEILEQLPEINFDIIFVTAYDEYAIKAIKSGAIDYLLKPIDEEELNKALNKFTEKSSVLDTVQKEVLLDMISSNETSNRVVIRTQSGIYFVNIPQLMYCKGEGNYTTFYTENGKSIKSSKPLREYISILPKAMFMKVHQSYMVNFNFIECYRNSSEILMKDEFIVPVSNRYKDLVLERLT